MRTTEHAVTPSSECAVLHIHRRTHTHTLAVLCVNPHKAFSRGAARDGRAQTGAFAGRHAVKRTEGKQLLKMNGRRWSEGRGWGWRTTQNMLTHAEDVLSKAHPCSVRPPPNDNIHLFTQLSAWLLPLPLPRRTVHVWFCVYLCAHDLHDVYAHVLLPTYDLWPTALMFSLFLTPARCLLGAGKCE